MKPVDSRRRDICADCSEAETTAAVLDIIIFPEWAKV
jgi:hypothetical protein